MGADVIKIEPPGGDTARRHGPFFHGQAEAGKSIPWLTYNLNKRGITLDLTTATGKDILRRLVATASFLVESSPPGYLDKLGLGFQSLIETNPRLVMVSITPFGQSGPHSSYKADDMVAMATGGMMAICGDSDRPPLQVGMPLAFGLASAQATSAAMLAHYQQLRTGRGSHVDVSIQEAVVDTLHTIPQFWHHEKVIQHRGSKAYGGRMTRDSYRVKDGYVSLQLYWGKGPGTRMNGLLKWMQAEGCQADIVRVDFNELTGFSITQEQVEHWEDEVAAFLSRFTKAEAYERALQYRAFLFPVNSPKDLAEDSQLRARGFFKDVHHPELSRSLRYPGPFCKFAEASSPICRRAPLIGEHNHEIYVEEMGFSGDDLRMLKESGIV